MAPEAYTLESAVVRRLADKTAAKNRLALQPKARERSC